MWLADFEGRIDQFHIYAKPLAEEGNWPS